MRKKLTNIEKWKKSLIGGLIFTFLFFIFFLIIFRNTELTIFEIFKILRTSFFLSIPFYFMRRIILSNKPLMINSLNNVFLYTNSSVDFVQDSIIAN